MVVDTISTRGSLLERVIRLRTVVRDHRDSRLTCEVWHRVRATTFGLSFSCGECPSRVVNNRVLYSTSPGLPVHTPPLNAGRGCTAGASSEAPEPHPYGPTVRPAPDPRARVPTPRTLPPPTSPNQGCFHPSLFL